MKILLVISSLSNGGAERVVCRLASELCSRHEVHVACTYPVGNANGTYPIDPRVTVHTINSKYNIFARTPALAYHAEQRSKAKNLRTLKWRERFDVCASFLTSCNYNNVMSRAGEPTLISIRNMLEPTLGAERLTPDAMKRVIAKTGRMADMVVCVANGVADEQTSFFGVDPDKIRIVHNPIDIEDVQRQATFPVDDEAFNAFRDSHGFVIANIGRLAKQKAQHHLIRAFARSRNSHPDAGLVILGRGDLSERLAAVAKANGVAEHVFFAGFAHNPFSYLTRCDAYALSSLHEGFPNALLEASALGLPCIACDCPSGARDLLAPGTGGPATATGLEHAPYGLLVPVCSGDELLDEDLQPQELLLSQAIDELASSDALREQLSAAARERAAQFATPVIAAQWEALFEELVTRGAR